MHFLQPAMSMSTSLTTTDGTTLTDIMIRFSLGVCRSQCSKTKRTMTLQVFWSHHVQDTLPPSLGLFFAFRSCNYHIVLFQSALFFLSLDEQRLQCQGIESVLGKFFSRIQGVSCSFPVRFVLLFLSDSISSLRCTTAVASDIRYDSIGT